MNPALTTLLSHLLTRGFNPRHHAHARARLVRAPNERNADAYSSSHPSAFLSDAEQRRHAPLVLQLLLAIGAPTVPLNTWACIRSNRTLNA